MTGPMKYLTRSRVQFALLAWSIVLAVVLAFIVVASSFDRNRSQIDAVSEAANLIQRSRLDGIRSNCEDRNSRNRKTTMRLDALIKALPAGPEKRRAVRNRDGTKLLINALAPVRDCDALVDKARVPQA